MYGIVTSENSAAIVQQIYQRASSMREMRRLTTTYRYRFDSSDNFDIVEKVEIDHFDRLGF